MFLTVQRLRCLPSAYSSASGASTLSAVKKTADAFGIPVSEKEFHCAASWIFINKGLPTEEDLKRAGEFASGLAE